MLPIVNDHKQSYIGGIMQVDGRRPLGFGTILPTFVFTQDNTTKAAILYNMLTYQNGFLVVREDPKLLDDAGEIPKS